MSNNLDLILDWPLEQTLDSVWRSRCQSGQSFKNCYVGFGSLWQVKLFLGREQRVLGYSRNGVRACRFADMAITYFLPYRKRKLRPLTDADLNFSVAQANQDLEEIPLAKALLVKLESALLSRAFIEPVIHLENEPSRSLVQLRKDFQMHLHQLGIDFTRAKAVLSSNPDNKIQLEMFSEHLSQTAIYVRSLDALLNNHVGTLDQNAKQPIV